MLRFRCTYINSYGKWIDIKNYKLDELMKLSLVFVILDQIMGTMKGLKML